MSTSAETSPDLKSIPGLFAKNLDQEARKILGIKALAKVQPIRRLAEESHVSPKFIHQQLAKAKSALDREFQPQVDDDTVLFQYPVTKARIRQMALGLMLNGHASLFGVQDWFRDIFDYSISIGTLHNIFISAMDRARQINAQEDLSGIHIGVHDEIFQGNPVLVGIEPASTFCYLLAPEPARDANTWGYHLLELMERGFSPEYTVADFGKGLRAGQAEAMPGTACWGDIFHAQWEIGKIVYYFENRAWAAMGRREKLERQMDRAKKKAKGHTLSKELALARDEEARSIQAADDLGLLLQWFREDVLNLVGPELTVRRELYDFIVEELKAREEWAAHRIHPVRILLENHREELLAFSCRIDNHLRQIAKNYRVSLDDVRSAYELKGIAETDPCHWRRENELWKRLGPACYQALRQGIDEMLEGIVRASSLVENFNSRLRTYFFLRRHLGPEYLELLRFFFNHRAFPRSRKECRVGKTPAEILAGNPLPHWLEQLGFQRFRRAA